MVGAGSTSGLSGLWFTSPTPFSLVSTKFYTFGRNILSHGSTQRHARRYGCHGRWSQLLAPTTQPRLGLAQGSVPCLQGEMYCTAGGHRGQSSVPTSRQQTFQGSWAKHPQKWALGGRGHSILHFKIWLQWQAGRGGNLLPYLLSVFKPKPESIPNFSWLGMVIFCPIQQQIYKLKSSKHQLLQMPTSVSTMRSFYLLIYLFLRKRCQSPHLVFKITMGEVHHRQYI